MSAFWEKHKWYCKCGKANNFTARDCKICERAPSNVVTGLQHLSQGDHAATSADAMRCYKRGLQADPLNTVLLHRLETQSSEMSDVLYPNDEELIKELFGDKVYDQWWELHFKLSSKPANKASSNWSCAACTFHNSSHSKKCTVCGSFRTVEDEIRKICRSLGVSANRSREFEELYNTCTLHKVAVPRAGECADDGMRKLRNLMFDDAIRALELGARLVEGSEEKYGGEALQVSTSEMYKLLLRAVTLEQRVSGDGLSLLVEVRRQYGISDEDHDRLLGEIGLSVGELKKFGERGGSSGVFGRECVVCSDNHAIYVVVECMHLVACQDCVALVETDKNCPHCRKAYSKLKRVY